VCAWPYTEDSECEETFAESLGSRYDALVTVYSSLTAVLWLVLLCRVLQIFIDTGYLHNANLEKVLGRHPRTKAKSKCPRWTMRTPPLGQRCAERASSNSGSAGLNHHDRASLVVLTAMTLLLILCIDIHAWRGVIDWQVYLVLRSSAIHLSYFFVLIIADQFEAVSLMMTSPLTAMRIESTEQSVGRRALWWLKALVVPAFIVNVAAIFNDPGAGGSTDGYLELPSVVFANLILLVALLLGLGATRRILHCLDVAIAEDMESAKGQRSRKLVEVLVDRISKVTPLDPSFVPQYPPPHSSLLKCSTASTDRPAHEARV